MGVSEGKAGGRDEGKERFELVKKRQGVKIKVRMN